MSDASTERATRTLDDLPTPAGLPLLGNMHQIDIRALHRQIETWEAELGPQFTFHLGPRQVYVTADPEMAQTALRERPSAFRKFSAMTSVIDELGIAGVFSAEGERWAPQRKLVMRALAPKGLPAFFPTLKTITERLHGRWQQAAGQARAIDVVDDLTRFTVDVTASLSFGRDINTIEYDGDPIQQHISRIFPMITRRTNSPFPYWRYVHLPQDRRLTRSIRAVRDFVMEMIDRARFEVDAAPEREPQNLLQAMIIAAREPDSGIGDEEVYANVITLLLAGEDTTAHTLAWTMYHLAERPPVQQRLQQAADTALGERAVIPDFATADRLSLFEASAFEAMRFKPIAPLVFLETNQDTTLGDTRLPAGTPVFLALRSAMNSAAHFEAPADFVPERWTGTRHAPDTDLAHNGRAFMQFGAGPRVCPGRHLAIIEIRMALSMLARNFDLSFAGDPADVREAFHFTMLPDNLRMRLTPRGPGSARI